MKRISAAASLVLLSCTILRPSASAQGLGSAINSGRPSPEEPAAAEPEAAAEAEAKKDNLKLTVGTEKESTVNGLKYSSRKDATEGDSVLVSGYIQAKTPVLFLRGGTPATEKVNGAALDAMFQSLKKLE